MAEGDTERGEGFRHHPFKPQNDYLDSTVTYLTRPKTDAVITVRVIKNFEYRAMKALVLKHCDLTKMTVASLIDHCKKGE